MTKNVLEPIDKPTKKRGRKSKKEIEEASQNGSESLYKNVFFTPKTDTPKTDTPKTDTPKTDTPKTDTPKIEENIVVNIQENQLQLNSTSCIDEIINSDDENDYIIQEEQPLSNKQVAKKRGRKPKGGKIIQQIIPFNNNKESKPNVILHLKCSIKDLDSTNLLGSNLDSYSFSNQNNLVYDNIINNKNINFSEYTNISEKLTDYDLDNDNNSIEVENKNNDIRDIWKKLKLLEYKLHNNCIDNKKSACFWDTCEFDNPPIYIIKHFMNNTYHVYGCFCSPECGVAYLMKENIDSSIKFERYYLMNHVYSKVFNYNKNIKPAPDPFYMLEKFYGNLNIQEYRALLRNERLFLVVDKPLTRIMPELHEDNDDFIINNKIIPSNTYQIKKKLQKKITKKNILNERFGLSQN
jgi:hypothetical protein